METIFLMMKCMDRVAFVTEATGQVHKQTAKFVYLGATVRQNADVTVEITPRVLQANLRLRQYGLPLCTTSPPHRSGSKYGCSKPRSWKPCCKGVSRGAPPWPISPYCARVTTDCSSASSDGRETFATVFTLYPTQTRSLILAENVETTVRKRRIIFAMFVAPMGNEATKTSHVWGSG